MTQGYLALVLHAHLPFVRHPEHEDFLEEDWLFQAITETYIPLIQVFHGLVKDGVPFKLTLALSPPLLSMLSDELLQRRTVRSLDRSLELAEKGYKRAIEEDDALKWGLNIFKGHVTHPAVAEALGMEWKAPEKVLN